MGTSATQHGAELSKLGFTIDQVVHDYGDLCQAITDLAYESSATFSVDEFRTLNRCLDNAIAGAVSAFSHQRDSSVEDNKTIAMNERLGRFAHEVRNLLGTATLAYSAAKTGNLSLTGATGSVLEHSLSGLRTLVDRSLEEVRMTPQKPAQQDLFSLAEFVADIGHAARLEAKARGRTLTVGPVDAQLAVFADRDLLFSAVGNLLQNAFKFTRPNTDVVLSVHVGENRICIDVQDHCGGLPPGDAEQMFLPFTQNDKDKDGLGLGLSIARRSVESNQGSLSVRNVPGSGCVFTVDLPRHALAETSTK
jgi:signal transduction histidine kinase